MAGLYRVLISHEQGGREQSGVADLAEPPSSGRVIPIVLDGGESAIGVVVSVRPGADDAEGVLVCHFTEE